MSFLSGSVLELAATLGVALVAVAAGLRLVGGGLGLEAGLTVLILAPELYLPFRRLGAEYHASADGLAVAERMFALLDAPPAIASGGPRPAPSPATAPVRLERVSFAYPARPTPGARRIRSGAATPARRWRSSARAARARAPSRRCCSCLLEPTTGRICVGGVDLSLVRRARLEAAARVGPPASDAVSRHGRGEHPARRSRTLRAGRSATPRALAGADEFIRALPHGYDTLVGDGARPLSPGERRRIGIATGVPERRAARDPRRAHRRPRPAQRRDRVARRAAPAGWPNDAADRPPPGARRARRPESSVSSNGAAITETSPAGGMNERAPEPARAGPRRGGASPWRRSSAR